MKGPGPGGQGSHRPSQAEREKMKACLAEAGVTLPDFVPGQRPQLDDSARVAMKACHDKLRSESDGGDQQAEQAETQTVSSGR